MERPVTNASNTQAAADLIKHDRREKYGDHPFSRTENLSEAERERLAKAYVSALEETGVIAEIRAAEAPTTLIFSSVSTGSNEVRILRRLDKLLEKTAPDALQAILTDFALTPGKPVGEFEHIKVFAQKMDSISLSPTMAGLRPLSLSERLGAIWRAAEDDVNMRSRGATSGVTHLSTLLDSYRELLAPGGRIIIDRSKTSCKAVSTWEMMAKSVRPKDLTVYLKETLNIITRPLGPYGGINLVALEFEES